MYSHTLLLSDKLWALFNLFLYESVKNNRIFLFETHSALCNKNKYKDENIIYLYITIRFQIEHIST